MFNPVIGLPGFSPIRRSQRGATNARKTMELSRQQPDLSTGPTADRFRHCLAIPQTDDSAAVNSGEFPGGGPGA
jgi:hypothetical protein